MKRREAVAAAGQIVALTVRWEDAVAYAVAGEPDLLFFKVAIQPIPAKHRGDIALLLLACRRLHSGQRPAVPLWLRRAIVEKYSASIDAGAEPGQAVADVIDVFPMLGDSTIRAAAMGKKTYSVGRLANRVAAGWEQLVAEARVSVRTLNMPGVRHTFSLEPNAGDTGQHLPRSNTKRR